VIEPLLEARHLFKRYGGLAATNDVSIDIGRGEFHAVIGPNGAGKSTLIGLLSGEIGPDGGEVRFAGESVTDLSITERARRGLVRSYQITSILPNMTVAENVSLAVQARRGHSYRIWSRARADRSLREAAETFIDQIGLSAHADTPAMELAHGHQRQLELAMALATRPKLLLLDEPMAGMSGDESLRMISVLQSIKSQLGILLIEHDMSAVFALADRITVLVYGQVIASGEPAAIRGNDDVRSAYLGD